MSRTEQQLAEELSAKQALHELNTTYCRAIDRCDEQLLRSIWHDDAVVDYGFFEGPAAEFCKTITESNLQLERTFHSISNEYYLVNDDAAKGEVYVIGIFTANDDGKLVDGLVGGRYLDHFERRNGEWKIARRTYVLDWNMNHPNTSVWDEGLFGQIKLRGSQSRDDHVYTLFPDGR